MKLTLTHSGTVRVRPASDLWREWLAEIAGYPVAGDTDSGSRVAGCIAAGCGPFYELICSDARDKTFDLDQCRKLLLDFEAFSDDARETPGEDWLHKHYEHVTSSLRIVVANDFDCVFS